MFLLGVSPDRNFAFFKASSFFFNVTPKYPKNSLITKFQKPSKCLESNSIWDDAFSAQSFMLTGKNANSEVINDQLYTMYDIFISSLTLSFVRL